jgi:DNA-binding response OmpR family regulator
VQGQARVKIMLVDDDLGVHASVKARLEAAGFEVFARQSGLGTLKAITQFQPELVLLGLTQDEASGKALVQLMQRTRGVPRSSVVLFSRADDKTLERLADETGALGYIQDTSNTPAFLADVRTMLRRKQRVTGGVTRPFPVGTSPGSGERSSVPEPETRPASTQKGSKT